MLPLRCCRKYLSHVLSYYEGGVCQSLHNHHWNDTLLQRKSFVVSCSRNRYASPAKNKVFSEHRQHEDFYTMLESYRDMAQRTVMVVMEKNGMISSLRKACSGFGNFEMRQVSGDGGSYLKFLVTFSTKESASSLISTANSGLSFPTRVVCFACDMKRQDLTPHNLKKNKLKIPSKSNLKLQMMSFSENCQATPQEILQRFFVCQYVEDLVRSIYPSLMVIPFGSSVNDIGSHNGDLDMSLELETRPVKHSPWKSEVSARPHILTCIHGYMNLSLPACAIQLNIPHAVVPILKFHHVHMEIMCDLSFRNSEGIYMSAWLYTMTQYDKRFPILARVIKEWAKTNLSAIQNTFFLQLMVVFFLQTENVLPPMSEMIANELDKDAPLTLQKHSWRTDIPKSKNSKPVDVLLKEFFQYYCTMDLTEHTMCLQTGSLTKKTGVSYILMPNPFVSEKSSKYNVCRNVREKHVTLIKGKMSDSLRLLESKKGEPSLKDLFGNSNLNSNSITKIEVLKTSKVDTAPELTENKMHTNE